MRILVDFAYRLLVGALVLAISIEAMIITYFTYIWLHQRQLDIPLGVAIVVFAAVYTTGTLIVYLMTGETPD